MKKRIKITALLFAAIMLLSGCRSAFDKEYRSEEPYEDEHFEIKDDSTVQEVKNYRGMKNALMNLINSASEYGVIRTEKYTGDAEEDISTACFEVTRSEPMGIFAVDYITHSAKRIVSYYEIEIYITYKRTAEEIADVVTVRSTAEVQSMINSRLEVRADDLTIMQVSATPDERIKDFVVSAYRTDPASIPVCPRVTVNTYSQAENAVQKITEICFDYGCSAEKLLDMSSQLTGFVRMNVDISNYGDIEHVCSVVMDKCSPDPYGADNAYSTIIEGEAANSEGYAMAVKLMCNAAGLDSYVVEGSRDEERYFWNIINLMGDMYHLDLYSVEAGGEELRFMRDDEMRIKCRWDEEKYPAC